jgi:hypothetical protein
MRFGLAIVFSCLLVSIVKVDSVVDLVDDDFDTKLNSYDTALVMFYAPW